MTHLDPDLDRLGDALRASTTVDLAREEHAARLTETPGPAARTPLLGRRRSLAGGTLALAGAGAAIVVALGTSATSPALAVTREDNGSVLVTVNTDETTAPWVQAADRKLASMGIDEGIEVAMAPGAATVSGPVSCTPGSGAVRLTSAGYQSVPANPSGPPVRVLLGSDGTDTIPGGTTGAGTVHVTSCTYYTFPSGSASGNSGTSSTS